MPAEHIFTKGAQNGFCPQAAVVMGQILDPNVWQRVNI
jgi:hypothetical protein